MNEKHVRVPDPIKKSELTPDEFLVYAHMRSFMNNNTYTAYPSQRLLCKKCKMSDPALRNCIKNLISENYISITSNRGRNNVYKFDKLDKNFEMFTNEFLNLENITSGEKGYIIGLQSLSYKEGGFSMTEYSNKDISDRLNISLRTVNRYNKSLKEKGIMVEMTTKSKDINSGGINKTIKSIDLAQICQAILFVNERVDDHEIRIEKLEKMIELLSRENRSLKKEVITDNTSFEF